MHRAKQVGLVLNPSQPRFKVETGLNLHLWLQPGDLVITGETTNSRPLVFADADDRHIVSLDVFHILHCVVRPILYTFENPPG